MKWWLQYFYAHIGLNRQVVLLMDNLKAHIVAVKQQPPPSNIRIEWQPANATSMFQPLDQGIIQNTKHYYKRQYLWFLLHCFEKKIQPWTIDRVPGALTIYLANCWRKSSCISMEQYTRGGGVPQGGNTQQPTPEADETAVVNEVTGLFHQVVAAGQIEDCKCTGVLESC